MLYHIMKQVNEEVQGWCINVGLMCILGSFASQPQKRHRRLDGRAGRVEYNNVLHLIAQSTEEDGGYGMDKG